MKRPRIVWSTAFLLFCLLAVQFSYAVSGTQDSVSMTSYGSIMQDLLSSTVIRVDFENNSHFQYGPGAPIWDKTAGMNSPTGTFEPSTIVFRSGTTAARLGLTDPVDDASRRIHVEHEWDPVNDKHLWFSSWIYLPSDFAVDDWVNLHRSTEERWHILDQPWEFPTFEWFQICCNIHSGCYVAPGVYKIASKLLHGQVDNNGDGIDDVGPFQEYQTTDTINLGEWFNIKTYIYRDMTDGIYMMWLNGVLQWELHNVRTIGIDPSRFSALGVEASICTGMSLYTNTGASPKENYFDDLVLATTESDPTL